ncbi:MAG TPA: hypothetical protein VGH90_04220, partial [Chthoniobacteraceae bacterium]
MNAAVLGEQLRIDTRRVELAERRLPDIREQEKLGLKLPSDVAYSEELLRTSKLTLNLSRAHDASARMQLAVDILSRFNRLWIVVPIHDENALMSPDMWTLLGKRGRVVFERYREQVILVEATQTIATG